MLHEKYLSKKWAFRCASFNKNGQFGYSNPTKIDFYSTENLPNRNIGQCIIKPNSKIVFSFSQIMQCSMPYKKRVENNGKTLILEPDINGGKYFPKIAVYRLQL